MKYKVTRVYVVDAKSKAEARQYATLDTLEWESVKEASQSRGWYATVKHQVTGSK